MKANVQFVLDRSQTSIAAAAAMAADWVWGEKTAAEIAADRQALQTQAEATDTLEAAYNTACATRATTFDNYHEATMTLLAMSKTHYRKNPAALAQLKPLHADGDSEQGILDEGAVFARVWDKLDPLYVPDTGWTLTAFKAAGANCVAKAEAEGTALVAWNDAAKITDVMAADVEDTNVAWYADATRKFGPDTAHGRMLRSTVPTTYTGTALPQRPVIGDALALGGGKVHVDFHIKGATSARVRHRGPGEAIFTDLVDQLKGGVFDGEGLAPGVHWFEIIGVNSAGDGPESDDFSIAVT